MASHGGIKIHFLLSMAAMQPLAALMKKNMPTRHRPPLFVLLSLLFAPALLVGLGCKTTHARMQASAETTLYVPGVVVSTLAGNNATLVNGPKSLAQFFEPSDVAIDKAGNLYVADSSNHCIRKVSPQGDVSTFAGTHHRGFADGPGNQAQFSAPAGIAVDTAGNLYVADTGNHRIRKISPSGEVSTLAGSGETAGFADGAGHQARFHGPVGIAVDAEGNLYVADAGNHRIRQVSPLGEVSTFAGSKEGFVDCFKTLAQFNNPSAVALDAAGNLYVTDTWNSRIRKVSPKGDVSTVAGDSYGGLRDGPKNRAQFGGLSGIALDAAGNLYVADTGNHRIRKVSPKGDVSTLAGSGATGMDEGGGFADGPGNRAQFKRPAGMALDAAGNLYVADIDNHCIRKVSPKGDVSTFAGGIPPALGGGDFADGMGSRARLRYPSGMAADAAGNLYVADRWNHRIRKVSPLGEVSTVAGSGEAEGLVGSGEAEGLADGPKSQARLNGPAGVALDAAGNLYVAEIGNNRIRKVSPQGDVSTLAGSGETGREDGEVGGFADGPGNQAQFYSPSDIAVDAEGNLYVADTWNHRIRKVSPLGEVSTLAGSGETGREGGDFADGPGSQARFHFPAGIALDAAGNLYVADSHNHCIRKVSPLGEVSTVVGSAKKAGFADGPKSQARLNGPSGIALDAAGNLYVADTWNHRIRKVSPEGEVRTVAGSGESGDTEGNGNLAQFYFPSGIALDAAGKLYVTDTFNHCIRKVSVDRF